jgi:hypothetical protein
MEMGMTPDVMYGQNVFVPATATPYQYGYAGKRKCPIFVLCLSLVLTSFQYFISW